MTRTSAGSGRRRARGSFGQWTTGDHAGAVRDMAGWDASLLAVIDGGGCLRPTNTDDGDSSTEDSEGGSRRHRRTTGASRKGGRR